MREFGLGMRRCIGVQPLSVSLLLFLGSVACSADSQDSPPPTAAVSVPATATAVVPTLATTPAPAADVKDASYLVQDRLVTLRAGVSEIDAAPGSATKIVTRYWGNQASGDLNGDGTPDVAFLLSQTTGGTGTFYYAVAAIKTPNGFLGTNAILLGDRVAPQTTEIRNGTLIVNYVERRPGEPMTERPSVGVSKYLKVEGGTLVATTP